MAQTVNINFRMDSDLKKDLEETCSDMGMSMTTAFTIFAKTVVRERKIPFVVAADPFYSENNIRYLEKKMEDYKAGRLKTAEHELISPVAQDVTLNVAALKGPTGIGMVKLMKDAKDGATANKYNFTLAGAPDEITAKFASGEFDIAAVPVNLAAALYNKTKGNAQVMAVNTLGVLYILENGNSIHSISDLKGKTIYATGKGATPEYILNYLLEQNGIDPEKDITIEYKSEHAELATLMASGKAAICMLPEPNVTSVLRENKEIRRALNLTTEWDKATEKSGEKSTLAQGCIIVNKEFAQKNKAAVDQFLTEYKASVDYVTESAVDASQLVEEFGIMPKALIAELAIPNCNIIFLEGDSMKTTMQANLNVLFKANAKSIGGAMPGDDFYYSR